MTTMAPKKEQLKALISITNEEQAHAIQEIIKIRKAETKLKAKMEEHRATLEPIAREAFEKGLLDDKDLRTVVLEADNHAIEFQFQDSFTTKASPAELTKAGIEFEEVPVLKFGTLTMDAAKEVMAAVEKKFGNLTSSILTLTSSIQIKKGLISRLADPAFRKNADGIINQKTASIKVQ